MASRTAAAAAVGAAAAGAAAAGAAAAAAAAVPPSLDAMLASIEAGDLVEVPRLGEELLSVEARKRNGLSVSFGGLTMKVKVSDVSRVVKKEEQRQQQQAQQQQAAQKKRRKGAQAGGKERVRTVVRFDSNTLDLRGMRASEVSSKLGRAVDRASDLGTLWIIHGHGTGSLKQEVLKLLKQEPLVERWEDAPQREGGSGCTLAYLK